MIKNKLDWLYSTSGYRAKLNVLHNPVLDTKYIKTSIQKSIDNEIANTKVTYQKFLTSNLNKLLKELKEMDLYSPYIYFSCYSKDRTTKNNEKIVQVEKFVLDFEENDSWFPTETKYNEITFNKKLEIEGDKPWRYYMVVDSFRTVIFHPNAAWTTNTSQEFLRNALTKFKEALNKEKRKLWL